ncbi:MAG: prepilin peptidase [Hyphomicrobiales bacterium]
MTAAGAVAGGAAGWVAAGEQWRLYREPEQRASRAAGRPLLIRRGLLAAAGVLAIGLAFRPDHYAFGPALLTAIFCLVLLVLSSTDFERKIIPNRLTYPAIVAAIAFCWAWPDRSAADIALGGAGALVAGVALVIAGMLVGNLLGIPAIPFGIGDAKLILLLGLLCGWPAFWYALVYGIIAAGVVSVGLILRGGAKSVFAYGPYLALGGLVVLLWPDRFV